MQLSGNVSRLDQYRNTNDGGNSMNPRIPPSYEYLEPYIRKLLADASPYETNVFVIMRFLPSPPLTRIYDAVVAALAKMGLNALRADQHAYHPELWSNICTYMLSCSKAVVIFEDVEVRDFNPNVALELGFMLALNKDCLILKEKRLPKPPTDMIGRLWREFDSYAPGRTIPKQISRWLVDINWNPPPRAFPESVVRFVLREASAFHRVLETLEEEFRLEFEFASDALEMFRTLAERIASKGPIFQKYTLLAELAKDDSRLEDLVVRLTRVSETYLTRVIQPLKNDSLDSETAIKTAHAGVTAVLEQDFQLIQQIQAAFETTNEETI